MSGFQWSATYELGHEAMDATHREFVALVAVLQRASDAELPAVLDDFVTHTEAHFAQELGWMQASGFPPLHCHRTEHDEVMAVVADVRRHVAAGDLALGRALARELVPWFETHAATMDTALASWLKQTGWTTGRSD